ncbi:MAG: HNH endonuclease [Gammaproteobacteria bacterium]|nr:HNH endonuclease [Gammaproteobacteria bacterium]
MGRPKPGVSAAKGSSIPREESRGAGPHCPQRAHSQAARAPARQRPVRRRGGSGRRWARIRREVLDRDGWRCVKCGRAGRLEVDHIRPLHRGGSDSLDNLRSLCRGCHVERHRPAPSPSVAAWRRLVRGLMGE